MMTVHQVSEKTGVSIRTLHHYDSIGLLKASAVTEAGYRLYDDTALEKLQQILLYRELEFPLKEIRRILSSRDYDRNVALEQQIHLLELRREHLQGLIALAREMKENGGKNMSFDAFDTTKMDEYAQKAKETWGGTVAYREYEEKTAGRTKENQNALNAQMMDIFRRFGGIKTASPDSPEAVSLARELQRFISEHYYRCTDEILLSLGKMYAAGGEFTVNIDTAGGAGTANFACQAIKAALGK